MTNRVLAILKYARKHIAKGWCQNAAARDNIGVPVQPDAKWAVSWCTIGAVNKYYGADALTNEKVEALTRLRETLGGNVVAYNDHEDRTKEQVLALFDATIDELENLR